jgi:hypothetical protein
LGSSTVVMAALMRAGGILHDQPDSRRTAASQGANQVPDVRKGLQAVTVIGDFLPVSGGLGVKSAKNPAMIGTFVICGDCDEQ